MPDTPQNESGEATITTAHGERITYRRNNETGYWTATQEGMPDSWWLSRVASRAVDEIVALRSRLAEVERENEETFWLLEGDENNGFDSVNVLAAKWVDRVRKTEQRVVELEKALRSIGDWRLDKAIEHMASLRRVAMAAGLKEHDLSWIDRYHGWFLEAKEKIAAVVGVVARATQTDSPVPETTGDANPDAALSTSQNRRGEMSRYRKKPVVIEARQVTGENIGEVAHWCDSYVTTARDLDDADQWIEIKTLEGMMRANVGDWVIRGVKGEFYPCKPDIFEATYEPAEMPNTPQNESGGEVESLAAELEREAWLFASPSTLVLGRAVLQNIAPDLYKAATRIRTLRSQLDAAKQATAIVEKENATLRSRLAEAETTTQGAPDA